MPKQKSLVVNFIYNLVYTGLTLLFPLITSPYVSRVLGATNQGKVNFANTIVNTFLIFAVFGVTTYGIREVSKVRDYPEKLNRIFSEIFAINGIASLVTVAVYFIAIWKVQKFRSELPLYLVMSLTIILNVFSLDWFYQGIEEYRYITVRSFIFKLISLICLFIFVRQREDYVIYGLISVLATSLSGVLNYFYSRRFVRLTFKGLKLTRHLKGLIIFMMYSFISNIYLSADKVILGFLDNEKFVAFIEKSKSVVNMAVAISTAVSNVALPRASYYIENEKERYEAFVKDVPNYILWFAIPLAAGTMALSQNIMFILGGNEFLEASTLLTIMAVTIVLIPINTFYQAQVLVASGKEKWGIYISIVSSCVSLLLNISLIPVWGVLGAGLAYVASELCGTIIKDYLTRKKLNYGSVRIVNRSTLTYTVAAAVIGGISVGLNHVLSGGYVLPFLASAFIGAAVYVGILTIAREDVTMKIWKKLKMMLRRRTWNEM